MRTIYRRKAAGAARRAALSVSRLLLGGRGQLAAHLFARAFRDVFPLVRVVVGLGRAGAGMRAVRRSAVVLTGLHDAVAFLFAGAFVLSHRGAGTECEQTRERAADDELTIHDFSF